MAHRYPTRSKKATHAIDLTKTSPARAPNHIINYLIKPPGAPKKGRYNQTLAAGASDWDGQNTSIRDDPIENNELGDAREETSILPCLNNSFNGTPEILTCLVCFEALSAKTKPRATHCGHIFCGSCLAMSLERCKRCPTCQTVTEFSTSIRIYF